MKNRLALIVPSKNRPDNAKRLLHACNETGGDYLTRLTFAIDHDERDTEAYQACIPPEDDDGDWSWARVIPVIAEPQRLGPVLNTVAALYAGKYDYIGFMGDDHLPRTKHWDELLIESLEGRPGVAYGNDLIQGEKIPTACVISSDIIRALGFMSPPGLDHLYFDDFWKFLGTWTGNFRYSPDVIIEHMHPTVGRGDWDESYMQNNDPSQFAKDQHAYQNFLALEWDACALRLKAARIA